MRHSLGGFTIIESMMYLAIAGVIFIASVGMLSNRQKSNQFNQSVREFESSLNDISNNTSTGVYPFIEDVKCEVSGGNIALSTVAGNKPGENNDCIFVGTVVQLTTDTVGSDYYLHTLVGQSNSTVSSFATSNPIVLHRLLGTDTPVMSLPWGTKITKAFYTNATDTYPINGIGYIYSNFGSNQSIWDNNSGAADITLYAIAGSTPTASVTDLQNEMDFQATSTAQYVPVEGLITICLEGADESKEAMIEIGGSTNSYTARTNYDVAGSGIC